MPSLVALIHTKLIVVMYIHLLSMVMSHFPLATIGKLLCYTLIHLRLIKVFVTRYTCVTEHDVEMKLTSIGFSCRVTDGCRSSWLQIPDNQPIDCFPYIRYMYSILTASIIPLEYVNKSQANAHVHVI